MKRTYEMPEIQISEFTTESIMSTSAVGISIVNSAPGSANGAGEGINYSELN